MSTVTDTVFSKAFKKMDIDERLNRVKIGHGPYRMAQDALYEIKTQRFRAATAEARVNELLAENALLHSEVESLRGALARLRLEAAAAA